MLFINLFCLGPKGCKLLKINSSFSSDSNRKRGKKRIQLFTSFDKHKFCGQ